MFGLNTRKIGTGAEQTAAVFLKNSGYTIMAKNYTIRGGEIDIIARDGDSLVFVEVKMRNGNRFGSAVESLTPRKINALYKTAMFYISKINWGNRPIRFDLVTIDNLGKTSRIELVKNIIES